MSEKLTPWFPRHSKPTQDGVYQTRMRSKDTYYSFFDGEWHGNWISAFDAWVNRGFGSRLGCPPDKWRGLAKKP